MRTEQDSWIARDRARRGRRRHRGRRVRRNDGRQRAGQRRSARAIRRALRTMHVQGNVHVVLGAGSNIAVQLGNLGSVLVDTGTAQNAEAGARVGPAADAPAGSLHHQHAFASRPRGRQRADRRVRRSAVRPRRGAGRRWQRGSPSGDHRARGDAQSHERAGRSVRRRSRWQRGRRRRFPVRTKSSSTTAKACSSCTSRRRTPTATRSSSSGARTSLRPATCIRP